jgi:hypothetical protein
LLFATARSWCDFVAMVRIGLAICFAFALANFGQAAFLKQVRKHHNVAHHNNVAQKKSHPHADLCPFGYGTGCGGGGQLSQATKDQVANILKGIISNLGNKKGLTQISADVIKTYGLHQAKNAEVKKAFLGLLTAFQRDKAAATAVVNQLTGEPHQNLGSFAAVSRVLSRTFVEVEPVKATPRAKWQPLKTDKPSAPPPKGPIVKK